MIESGTCKSFLNELVQGLHNFAVAGDTFKFALYENSSGISSATTVYSTTGEVSGTNYTAGGEQLTSVTPVLTTNTSLLDFDDLDFTTLTVSNIGGGLIYNSTNGNKAVAVLKFNEEQSAVGQTVSITFPGVTINTAILRIKANG